MIITTETIDAEKPVYRLNDSTISPKDFGRGLDFFLDFFPVIE
jgi:hypothetical protein